MKEINELLDVIRIKRKEKGISQREIADYLNISQPAYQAIEDGKTSLKVETLYQIANYLEIDIITTKSKENNLPTDTNNDTDELNKIDKIEAKQDDMNQKLDELLAIFKKKKK